MGPTALILTPPEALSEPTLLLQSLAPQRVWVAQIVAQSLETPLNVAAFVVARFG
jgi:hypothetical protein